MSEPAKERKPMSKKKKIILFVALGLALLLLALIIPIVIHRLNQDYRFVREDGICYLKFRDYYHSDGTANISYKPTEFSSVSSLQNEILLGTSDYSFEEFYTDCDNTGRLPIFDITKADNICTPDKLSLSRIVMDAQYFQFCYDCEKSDEYVYIYAHNVGSFSELLDAYEVLPYNEDSYGYKLTDTKTGHSVLRWVNEKEIRYTIQDGNHTYYIKEFYDSVESAHPNKTYILYHDKTYNVFFDVMVAKEGILPENWIKSFRYEPSFWEKIFG